MTPGSRNRKCEKEPHKKKKNIETEKISVKWVKQTRMVLHPIKER